MAAALTPAACVTGIVTVLNTIPNIGVIHPQRRQLRSEPQAQPLLFDPNQNMICAWMISPAGTATARSERHPGHFGPGQKGGGNVLTTFQFQIEGFYAISEQQDSEQKFRDLSWAVADEFNAYGLIPVSPVGALVFQEPADLQQFGYALVAQAMLLHYARIEIGLKGRTRGG